jgi:NADH:ubiquinone oxidoreductase subunit K
MLYYFIALAIALFSIGLAGIISSRHLVIIVFSAEIIFAGSIIAAVGFFTSQPIMGGSFPILILGIWAVASAEVMVLIAFYIKMKNNVQNFDVNILNKFRD